MMKILISITSLVTLLFAAGIWKVCQPPDLEGLPKPDPKEWWGPKSLTSKIDDSIKPFEVKFSEEMIKDLKRRLTNHRSPPPPLEGVGFQYGFNSELLPSWLRYWREQYPFAEREQLLNQLPQFKTNIQGLDIHFIRVKPQMPPGVEVVPLLIMHGWPGSVREFYEAIPYLTRHNTNYNFIFEVIAPSLPGFGFSDAAVRPGLGAHKMAVIMRNLMHRIGHKQFYIQGGDWGSIIGTALATLYPDEVLGFHSNLAMVFNPRSFLMTLLGAYFPSLVVEPHLASRMYPLYNSYENMLLESGYYMIQSTKPDTIGVAVNDSPAGLLAYTLEKFTGATRRQFKERADGGLEEFYSKDQLIDNLMLYWVSGSMTSSMRLYAESFKPGGNLGIDSFQTSVPTWALQAANEIYQPPEILKTKFTNLINVTVLEDGGHYIALEKPEIFANDVFKAVKEFKDWHAMIDL